MILQLKDISYSYINKYQRVDVLHGLNCGFEEGKAYGIVGKSGSGKSTMMMLMAGLDLPQKGDVLYNGVSTAQISLPKYRRENVSVIYQNFRLFPLLTAVENVMYPMELRKTPAREAMEKAKELILSVGLTEATFNRFPNMLSGGEQQRVAIARALAVDTKLLLADEPTGNLDQENSKNVIDILKSLAHDKNYCVVIVTHDVEVFEQLDEVYRIRDGVISRVDNEKSLLHSGEDKL